MQLTDARTHVIAGWWKFLQWLSGSKPMQTSLICLASTQGGKCSISIARLKASISELLFGNYSQIRGNFASYLSYILLDQTNPMYVRIRQWINWLRNQSGEEEEEEVYFLSNLSHIFPGFWREKKYLKYSFDQKIRISGALIEFSCCHACMYAQANQFLSSERKKE